MASTSYVVTVMTMRRLRALMVAWSRPATFSTGWVSAQDSTWKRAPGSP